MKNFLLDSSRVRRIVNKPSKSYSAGHKPLSAVESNLQNEAASTKIFNSINKRISN